MLFRIRGLPDSTPNPIETQPASFIRPRISLFTESTLDLAYHFISNFLLRISSQIPLTCGFLIVIVSSQISKDLYPYLSYKYSISSTNFSGFLVLRLLRQSALFAQKLQS